MNKLGEQGRRLHHKFGHRSFFSLSCTRYSLCDDVLQITCEDRERANLGERGRRRRQKFSRRSCRIQEEHRNLSFLLGAEHMMPECSKKKRCPNCGDGFVRWLEVEKNSKNQGKLFHSCTHDCGFFKFCNVSPDEEYPLQGESSGTTEGSESVPELSRMLKVCAKITME